MRFRTALVTLLYSLSLLPATALAAVEKADLTPEEQKIIFRPCTTVDSDKVLRCEARQLARLNIAKDGIHSLPTAAHDLYEKIDLGGALRRKQAERARLAELRELRKGRRTYSQYDPKEDPNVAQASYVGDLRLARLKCQYEKPGRPRSLCFDKVAQQYRDIMRAQRGSLKSPGQ